jgi:hypothetical protein
MTKAEKAHKTHSGRLEKMQARRSELQESYQQAQDALKVSGFGDALIEGKPVDKLAADLSRQRNEVSVYEGALAELDNKISAEQAAVDEAAQVVSAEAAAEAARQIRTASLEMIEKMAALQVDLYKCLQQQQRHMQRSPILDFNGAADRLAAAQEMLEKDEGIVSRSKVPRGRRIAGFIDDTHTVASLGSQVRDWARQEVLG